MAGTADNTPRPRLVWDAPRPQHERPSLEEARRRIGMLAHQLEPAGPEMAALELSRCLTLCAPSGMTQDDRTEWITVAVQDVEEIALGALQRSCKAARLSCRHPSELIPAILSNAATIEEDLLREHRWAVQALHNLNAPILPPLKPVIIDEAEHDEVKKLMSELLAEMRKKANAGGGAA